MTDVKAKATNGVNGVNGVNGITTPVPAKSLNVSKLSQLLTLASEIGKDADTIRDFESAIEAKKKHEQDLKAKKNEVERLREFNDKLVREFADYKVQAGVKTDALFAEFEKKYKAYDADRAATEVKDKEVQDLRAQLQAAAETEKKRDGELAKLKQRVKKAEIDEKGHVEEMKEMNAECEIHRARMQTGIMELDAYRMKLADAKRDLGDGTLQHYGPDALKKLSLDIKGLSDKCHNMALEYFNDRDSAKDASSEIEELRTLYPKIPLSTASTKPAGLLRAAVAEAVLAQMLSKHVFVPFYLGQDARTAATTMLEIFGGDENARSIYRCQVLRSACGNAEEAAKMEDDVVRKASNEVRTTLHALVGANRQGSFYNVVPVLVREALVLWRAVQRAKTSIAVEDADLEEHMPGRRDDYGAAVPNGNKGSKGQAAATPSPPRRDVGIAATLFPKVASREDVIFAGMALWTDQAVDAGVPTPASGAKNSTNAVQKNGVGNGDGGKQVGGVKLRRKSVAAADVMRPSQVS